MGSIRHKKPNDVPSPVVSAVWARKPQAGKPGGIAPPAGESGSSAKALQVVMPGSGGSARQYATRASPSHSVKPSVAVVSAWPGNTTTPPPHPVTLEASASRRSRCPSEGNDHAEPSRATDSGACDRVRSAFNSTAKPPRALHRYWRNDHRSPRHLAVQCPNLNMSAVTLHWYMVQF